MNNSFLAYWLIVTLAAIATLLAPDSAIASDGTDLDFSLSSSTTTAIVPESPVLDSPKAVEPLAVPTDSTPIPTGRFDEHKALTQLPPPPESVPLKVQAPIVEPMAEPDGLAGFPLIKPTAPSEPAPIKFLGLTPAPTTDAPIDPVPEVHPPDEAAMAIAPVVEPAPLQRQTVDGIAPEPSTVSPEALPEERSPQSDLDAMFAGGSDSLIARAIGSAEGTRTPDGGHTRAYRGHQDPGNGRWNLGTFSYQHGAETPEQADQKQLARLRGQADTLQAKAQHYGLQLNLEEKLNGLDLANQSPRAALSRGGYVERLKQAQDMGLSGTDAILWARTRSFLDPDTNRWNAPGLGNTVERITADQSRRLRAIARAIAAKPLGDRSDRPSPTPDPAIGTHLPQQSQETMNADRIINFDLPQATAQPNPPASRQFLFGGT